MILANVYRIRNAALQKAEIYIYIYIHISYRTTKTRRRQFGAQRHAIVRNPDNKTGDKELPKHQEYSTS